MKYLSTYILEGGVRNFSIPSLSYALVFARSNETICHLHALKCIIRDRRFEKCLNFVDSVLLSITTGCDDDLSGSGLRGSKPASIAFEVRQVLDRRLTIDIFQVRLVFSQSPELGLERTRTFRTSNQPNTRFMV